MRVGRGLITNLNNLNHDKERNHQVDASDLSVDHHSGTDRHGRIELREHVKERKAFDFEDLPIIFLSDFGGMPRELTYHVALVERYTMILNKVEVVQCHIDRCCYALAVEIDTPLLSAASLAHKIEHDNTALQRIA